MDYLLKAASMDTLTPTLVFEVPNQPLTLLLLSVGVIQLLFGHATLRPSAGFLGMIVGAALAVNTNLGGEGVFGCTVMLFLAAIFSYVFARSSHLVVRIFIAVNAYVTTAVFVAIFFIWMPLFNIPLAIIAGLIAMCMGFLYYHYLTIFFTALVGNILVWVALIQLNPTTAQTATLPNVLALMMLTFAVGFLTQLQSTGRCKPPQDPKLTEPLKKDRTEDSPQEPRPVTATINAQKNLESAPILVPPVKCPTQPNEPGGSICAYDKRPLDSYKSTDQEIQSSNLENYNIEAVCGAVEECQSCSKREREESPAEDQEAKRRRTESFS